MARGSTSAVPATPAKAGGARTAGSSAGRPSARMATVDERSVAFEASDDDDSRAIGDYESHDEGHEATPGTEVKTEVHEDAVLTAGSRGAARPLARNLAEELEAVSGPDAAYDDSDESSDEEKPPAKSESSDNAAPRRRPPVNGDTPAANKVLARCLEAMRTSEWVSQFNPRSVRQATWVILGDELAHPVNSLSTRQVAEDTVSLLRAMGAEIRSYPSNTAMKAWSPSVAGAELFKWKKRLRTAFGVKDIGKGRQPVARAAIEIQDPSRVPLPETPKKETAPEANVFAAAGGSPYFQDSHMVTPRSTTRFRRGAAEASLSAAKRGRPSPSRSRRSVDSYSRWDETSSDSDGDCFDQVEDGDDPRDELTRQMKSLFDSDVEDSQPKLEVASHKSLDRIKPFVGKRNKSENSMQWLKRFVYEMKGTRTPPDEWCPAFELSLRDGAIHWFRQLPKKTRRKWKLLSQEFMSYYCSQFTQPAPARYYSATRERKEHICDYLNRLNGYARNARLQIEKGERDAKDHVQQFLLTYGDDKLNRDLGRLGITNIRQLEKMINDMLKGEERMLARGSSQQLKYGGDSYRRSEDRRRDDARDDYGRRERRERRDYDRRRDDSRYTPRVTLAEASLADLLDELEGRESRDTRRERPNSRRSRWSDSDSDEDAGRSFPESDIDSYASDESDDLLAAANDNERRAAAEGTYARTDNRQRRGERTERTFNGDRRDMHHADRANRRRDFGPCAACGGANHSAHRCFKRCKFCKQVHDVGQCELFRQFQDLTKFVRTKVDKKELPTELQTLVDDGHLN